MAFSLPSPPATATLIGPRDLRFPHRALVIRRSAFSSNRPACCSPWRGLIDRRKNGARLVLGVCWTLRFRR